ncbi:MAG: glutaminyl-peptide cyclotransferase [Candidatus Sumerlaeia bacterium]|nr:glutaminyl-peptide cyclotransferase [Candidatus Sumerlaeia bacterium]
MILLLVPVAGLTQAPRQLVVEVIHTYPHDPGAFTQGLFFHEGKLYESTGKHGKSSLREVRYTTGEVVRQVDLPHEFFGEGLEMVGDLLYQLTWRENTAFVWDLETFQQVNQFQYEGEGWGLTYNGEHLIMTSGSTNLYFRDPDTFALVHTQPVTLDGRPQRWLNELEYVDGLVWANIFMEDKIVAVDPRTGRITKVVDCSGLLEPQVRRRVDVLNGIAWHPERETFFITGKYWPKLFEVRFVEPDSEDPEEDDSSNDED